MRRSDEHMDLGRNVSTFYRTTPRTPSVSGVSDVSDVSFLSFVSTVSETRGLLLEMKHRGSRILFYELFKFSFIRMIGDLREKFFVFGGGECRGLCELIEVRELKMQFGHAGGVELDGLIQRLSPERSLLRQKIRLAEQLIDAGILGHKRGRMFEDLDSRGKLLLGRADPAGGHPRRGVLDLELKRSPDCGICLGEHLPLEQNAREQSPTDEVLGILLNDGLQQLCRCREVLSRLGVGRLLVKLGSLLVRRVVVFRGDDTARRLPPIRRDRDIKILPLLRRSKIRHWPPGDLDTVNVDDQRTARSARNAKAIAAGLADGLAVRGLPAVEIDYRDLWRLGGSIGGRNGYLAEDVRSSEPRSIKTRDEPELAADVIHLGIDTNSTAKRKSGGKNDGKDQLLIIYDYHVDVTSGIIHPLNGMQSKKVPVSPGKGDQTRMKENVTVVFNGFLNLPNLEKLELVNAINEYFDSNDREPIRKAADERFAAIDRTAAEFRCKCCSSES